jgi:hypothetical protein
MLNQERNRSFQLFANRGRLILSNKKSRVNNSIRKPKKTACKKVALNEKILEHQDEFVVLNDNKKMYNGKKFEVNLKYQSKKNNLTKFYGLKILSPFKKRSKFILMTSTAKGKENPKTFCKVYSDFLSAYHVFKKKSQKKIDKSYKEVDLGFELFGAKKSNLNSATNVSNFTSIVDNQTTNINTSVPGASSNLELNLFGVENGDVIIGNF